MACFHNCRIKRFPDGSADVLVGSRPFGGGDVSRFLRSDDEPFDFRQLLSPEERAESDYASLERDAIALEDDAGNLADNAAACRAASVRRAVRRARSCVRDLARANFWRFFVTLTLDPQKVNRYDPVEVLRHLRFWLDNNVRRKGLAYVLVPEHHKDGAIHFHGLFNDALEAVDSGHKDGGGHTVYNLPGWGWGFSTAIELYGERDAAINYVCKYIGKQMDGSGGAEAGTPEKIGGRWYYSGGKLERPAVEWVDVDLRDFEDLGGWWSPEGVSFVSFLSLRVAPDGSVSCYSKAEERTNVSCETPSAPERKCGAWRRDDPAPEGRVMIPAVPSFDPSQLPPVRFASPSFAGPGLRSGTTLNAETPRVLSDNFSQLTFFGLSTEHAPLAPQWPPGLNGRGDI